MDMLTFVVYLDQKNQWRWRLMAGNHRTIADSGEGYQNQRDCETAVDLIRKDAPRAHIRVEAVK
jgi:uncharacterized protein YegP (UPF0339 family)